MNLTPFYFDVLPIHPQPEPLESFTSYLMRLGEANGIQYPYDLGHRLFPGQNSYVIRILTDHVPVSFGSVPQQACCSETRLLATTFHHLGRKFGRSLKGRTSSSFLHGTIAPSLRYCPLCLQQEQPYYRLPWRFLSLTSCGQHGCRLLDRCGACHQPIRLLHSTMRVGVCPSCQTPLHTAAVEPLSAQEQWQNEQMEQDLTYLLSPQFWETGDVAASVAVGHSLKRLRWQRKLNPADLAHQIGLSSTGVRHLERGKTQGAGVSFQRYLRYAGFMGVSLRQLFRHELDAFEPLPDSQPTREMEITPILQTAIEQLQANDQPVNRTTIRQTTGISKDVFRRYPETKTMMAQAWEQTEQQREEAFLERVKSAIRQLRKEGETISLTSIGRVLKKKPRDLKTRPLVWDYLQQLTPPLEPQPQRGEAAMLARVQEAVQFFADNGQSFTHQDIADHLGVVAPNLYRHPWVTQLLQQLTAAKREQEQKNMLEQVRAALARLDRDGQPITRQAIIALTGISYRRLSKYPHIDTLVAHHLEADRRRYKEERMNEVRQAICYLKENELPVTKKAICQLAGIGKTLPNHCPELMPIIRSVLAEEKQRHEQELVERAEQAIQYLLAHDQAVTLAAIGQIVGLSAQRLRLRPQISALVRQTNVEIRERFEDDLIRRIHVAVQALQTAVLPLTQNNICAEIGMRRTVLPYYKRAKAIVDQIAVPYHQAQGTIWGSRHRQEP
jgi:DNA-binding transcriptional regulator YiaG